ncbi:hypothetical protein AAC387_Pa07g3180 [Persea americana]
MYSCIFRVSRRFSRCCKGRHRFCRCRKIEDLGAMLQYSGLIITREEVDRYDVLPEAEEAQRDLTTVIDRKRRRGSRLSLRLETCRGSIVAERSETETLSRPVQVAGFSDESSDLGFVTL